MNNISVQNRKSNISVQLVLTGNTITVTNRNYNISTQAIPGSYNMILPFYLANEIPYQVFNRQGTITVTNRAKNISVTHG